MKPIYFRFTKIALSAVLAFLLSNSAKAQTTLVAGDIAFTGYHGATAAADSFSFVLLKSITAGTVINFTDNAWLSTGAFRVGETHIAFTSIALPAGREIVIGLISGTSTARQAGNGASAGTITYLAGPNPMAFSTSGDQVIAYQGTIASPVFIAGIHMNVHSTDILDCANTTAAAWDPPCIDGAAGTIGNTTMSLFPTGLGTANTIWIGTVGVSASERDNARFTGCGLDLSTPALARAAINNPANWTETNNTNPPGFSLGSFCSFLGLTVLPVTIESFAGKLNSDKTATLQWKTGDQQDAQNYTLEESADGSSFRTLTTIIPGASNSYSYTDVQVATGNNYYRLKTTELSGKIAYSKTIVINLKAGMILSVYPNPVTDKLTVQQFGTARSIAASLADTKGTVLQNLKLTGLQQTINMEGYAPGIYLLKLDDGTVFKIIKQ